MGTRNLIAVYLDGNYRVAQYGQWDGYPTGQGAAVLYFLKYEMDREKFIDNVRACRFIPRETVEKLWEECGAKNGLATFQVSRAFKRLFPQLHRDTAAGVLDLIQAQPRALENEIMFAKDPICEYAYVIDFDHNVFEVYKGFNRRPLERGQRFHPLNGSPKDSYFPVRKLIGWPLDKLPEGEPEDVMEALEGYISTSAMISGGDCNREE